MYGNEFDEFSHRRLIRIITDWINDTIEQVIFTHSKSFESSVEFEESHILHQSHNSGNALERQVDAQVYPFVRH